MITLPFLPKKKQEEPREKMAETTHGAERRPKPENPLTQPAQVLENTQDLLSLRNGERVGFRMSIPG